MVSNQCLSSRLSVSFLPFVVWKSKPQWASSRLPTFLCFRGAGGAESQKEALSPGVTGRRWPSSPEHVRLRGCPGGSHRWTMKTQPQASPGGLPSWWPAGREGLGGAFLAAAMWQACLPPQPCSGSRWPDCREGLGRSNRGRGLGEEAEKAIGRGRGRVGGVRPARRLFNE